MKFLQFVRLETRQLLKIKTLFFPLLFMIIISFALNDGINHYKSDQLEAKKLMLLEKAKVQNIKQSGYYFAIGIQTKYIPGPLSIFFSNSGIFSKLSSNITALADLNLSQSFYGPGSFSNINSANSDFAGILFIWGSIMALFYGYWALNNKHFLRFKASVSGVRRSYIYLLFSRFLILGLFFTYVFIFGFLLILLKGVFLSQADYLLLAVFFAIWMLIVFCFLVCGLIIGTLKHMSFGIAAILVIWGLTIHFLPVEIDKIVANKANYIQRNTQAEYNKYLLLWSFESRALKAGGAFDPKKATAPKVHELIESFINNEYQQMRQVDKKVEKQMRQTTQFANTISAFTFPTFFKSFVCEISGKGHSSVNDFFLFNQELKHRFCLFHKEKRFYNQKLDIATFLKTNDNLYYGKVSLPPHTGIGIVITLLQLGFLIGISYYRYKGILYDLQPDKRKPDTLLPITLWSDNMFRKGQYYVLSSQLPRFSVYLFAILSGQARQIPKKFHPRNYKITLDGCDMIATPQTVETLYIPPFNYMPETIQVNDLLSYCAMEFAISDTHKQELIAEMKLETLLKMSFSQIKGEEKLAVIMAITLMKPYRVYILDNLSFQISYKGMVSQKVLMERLAELEGTVILLSGEEFLTYDNPDGFSDSRDNTANWLNVVAVVSNI